MAECLHHLLVRAACAARDGRQAPTPDVYKIDDRGAVDVAMPDFRPHGPPPDPLMNSLQISRVRRLLGANVAESCPWPGEQGALLYSDRREPAVRMSTSLLALCCQSPPEST